MACSRQPWMKKVSISRTSLFCQTPQNSKPSSLHQRFGPPGYSDWVRRHLTRIASSSSSASDGYEVVPIPRPPGPIDKVFNCFGYLFLGGFTFDW